MKEKISVVTVVRMYRKICESAFAHLPYHPRLHVMLGPVCAKAYIPNLQEEYAGYDLFAFFSPEEFKIVFFPFNHYNYREVRDTLVHELVHVEQFHRHQPMVHGKRFKRRLNKLNKRVKLGHYQTLLEN